MQCVYTRSSSWFGRAASELQQGRHALVLVGADTGFLYHGLMPGRLQARPVSMAQRALEHSVVHHTYMRASAPQASWVVLTSCNFEGSAACLAARCEAYV